MHAYNQDDDSHIFWLFFIPFPNALCSSVTLDAYILAVMITCSTISFNARPQISSRAVSFMRAAEFSLECFISKHDGVVLAHPPSAFSPSSRDLRAPCPEATLHPCMSLKCVCDTIEIFWCSGIRPATLGRFYNVLEMALSTGSHCRRPTPYQKPSGLICSSVFQFFLPLTFFLNCHPFIGLFCNL